MQIKNLKKTAQRIKKAIDSEERIILYGDADLDGITSIVILKEVINNLGGKNIFVYIPDRETEGYGITEKALQFLKSLSPALLVALDLGIGNFKETKQAKRMGFDVVIIDHHQTLEKLPDASLIVDPKQESDKSPFKYLATCGIVFKLTEFLLGDNFSENLRNNFLELVALGTIADMMPQREDNKAFIEEGLPSLETTYRPGLKVFFKTSFKRIYQQKGIRSFAYKIISALTVGRSWDHLHETYLLLTASSEEKAKELAVSLIEKIAQKRTRVREITEEVKERIADKLESPIVFEGSSDWPLVYAGTVASIICQEQKKPVFIYNKRKKKSQGGVRTPGKIDSVRAMKNCSHLLVTYGGHAPASGFTVKNKNLEKFEKCLIKYFKKMKNSNT